MTDDPQRAVPRDELDDLDELDVAMTHALVLLDRGRGVLQHRDHGVDRNRIFVRPLELHRNLPEAVRRAHPPSADGAVPRQAPARRGCVGHHNDGLPFTGEDIRGLSLIGIGAVAGAAALVSSNRRKAAGALNRGSFGPGRPPGSQVFPEDMLGSVVDVFRLRQYFNVVVGVRDLIDGVRDDAGFLDDARRALVPLPFDAWPDPESPFPLVELPMPSARDRASRCSRPVGAERSRPSSVWRAPWRNTAGDPRSSRSARARRCSGSRSPPGISADDVATFTLGLRPRDYVDVDWQRLLLLAPTLARGFAGIVRGDRLEATYRALLGDMTLAEMPIPAYAPIWNVEENRVEFLGPRTYPNVTVARAVRMAVSLPLFIEPVELAGYHWCDGGIVDIFPVIPALDLDLAPMSRSQSTASTHPSSSAKTCAAGNSAPRAS